MIGAARKISSLTDERSTNEYPSEPVEDQALEEVAVLDVDRVVQAETLLDLGDPLRRRRLPGREPRRVGGHEEEDARR